MCSLDHADVPDGNADFRVFQDYETGDDDVPVVVLGSANKLSLVCMLVGAKEVCEDTKNLMKLIEGAGRIVVEGDFAVEESLVAANNPIFVGNEPFSIFNI